LQRVDPKTGDLVEKPQGVVGCYKFFSTNTGYDARWDVGVIDYINGRLKWINHVGASWDLIEDLTTLRFKTNETNPYFPASFFIERTFDPKSGASTTCKQFKRQGIGFPLDSSAINLTPDPVFLSVLIDFSEQYSKNTEQELSRFSFEKVEYFWSKNSYGKSNLKIENHPTTVKLDQSGLAFDAGKEQEIWPLVIDKLSKSVDLSRYAGFVFATPASGPRLQAGYAAQVKVGKDSKKIVWMGGWNSTRENFVPVWKVVAHEFGHSYGLPDLYLTNGDNSAGKTLGPFDIMDGVTGISNSITFFQRWMLGWLSDSDVECHIPDANPKTIYLKPVSSNEIARRGIIIPISEHESLLIEARVKSEFDDLSGDQEGLLVYLSDTRIAGGKGPLRIIPSKNSWTLDPKRMDDVERFKYGALRSQERVSYEDTYVEFSGRDKDLFKVTITKGNEYFSEVDTKAAADKAAADKAAADKAAAEARAAAMKKTTITCIKGKVTKKVSAIKPKCPSGYKKK
jgi:M6 family metalloprotease-like protein